MWGRSLFGPDACELHDLAPLLGFGRDQFREVGRRAPKRSDAHIGEPPLELGIGESGIDLRVEIVDDLGRRIPRRAQTPYGARFVSRNELAYTRQVRQDS